MRLSTPAFRIRRAKCARTVRSSMPKLRGDLAIGPRQQDQLKNLVLAGGQLGNCGADGLAPETLSSRSMSLESNRRGAQMDPSVTTSIALRTCFRAGLQVEVGPGPRNDRPQHQFVVAAGSNHNQPDVGTRATDCLRALSIRWRTNCRSTTRYLRPFSGQQLRHACPGTGTSCAWSSSGRLVEDAGEPGEPNRLVRHQSDADWTRIASRRHE